MTAPQRRKGGLSPGVAESVSSQPAGNSMPLFNGDGTIVPVVASRTMDGQYVQGSNEQGASSDGTRRGQTSVIYPRAYRIRGTLRADRHHVRRDMATRSGLRFPGFTLTVWFREPPQNLRLRLGERLGCTIREGRFAYP